MKPIMSRFDQTRQKIGQAAYEIIQREGVAGLSMRELARAQYMSPSNLYEYFESKDAIVAYVFTATSTALTAYVQQVDINLPARDYVIALCLAYYDFAQRNPSHMLVLYDTAQAYARLCRSKCSRIEVDFFALLVTGVERYLQERGSSQLNSGEIACTLFAFAYGVAAGNLRNLHMISGVTLHAAIQVFLTGLT